MNDRIMDPAAVRDKYGVEPEQLLDCFALMGDSSDNVPGVPGIGPKTAAKLIQEYGSLEAALEAAPRLKASKMKERLLKYADQARLSCRLIRLDHEAPVPQNLEDYRLPEPDHQALEKLYTELEFTSLLSSKPAQTRLDTRGNHLVRNPEELAALAKRLGQASLLVLDTETTAWTPWRLTWWAWPCALTTLMRHGTFL